MVLAGFSLVVGTSGVVAPLAPVAAATFVVARALQTGLELTAPSSVSLGGGRPGDTLSRSMGDVTVRDNRPVNPNTWTATVTSTSFTTGAGASAATIPAGQMYYWSGPATRSTGGGTLVPGQPTRAQAETLAVPRTAFRKSSGNGRNRVTWNPTLMITLPSTAVAGLYRGTVTHSVS
ncbi:hypothetical protein MCAG_02565 [Micromonospora sp. ATCC 39149]|nr:hypothetical protein MCAG_02565 [Micromonospora sp. ATCC 39149]